MAQAKSDTPTHPLTLYRITLETNDFITFNFLVELFRNHQAKINSVNEEYFNERKKYIIGVESRVRERINK